MDSEKSKTVFAPSKLGWTIIIVVILAIAAVPSYYFYNQYQKNQSLQNPNEAANIQAQKLIDKVGALIELPQNEQPQIATVSDKTKLSGQAFFARAENGDKVLIFSATKKAILYRPSTNKIIEVSVLNIEVNKPPPVSSSSASPALSPTVTAKPVFIPSPAP
ncbi:MAG: hypothetical protein M1405_01990 [Patescibacteria group bacterium]|nr:hypothetical protein [Patescibacteria group bacterium]